jgi:large-conductance mechanosensitive channel
MQEFIDLLSKVIFFTIIATIVLAVVTYAAYKARSSRRGPAAKTPQPILGEDGSFLEPVLFEKYVPEGKEKEGEEA